MHNQSSGQGQARDHRGHTAADQMSWDDIKEPGSYMDVRSRELYQFPEKAFVSTEKTTPLVKRISNSAPTLILLTTDPEINLTEARKLVEERGFSPNF